MCLVLNLQLMLGPWYSKQEMKQPSFASDMDMKCPSMYWLNGNYITTQSFLNMCFHVVCGGH